MKRSSRLVMLLGVLMLAASGLLHSTAHAAAVLAPASERTVSSDESEHGQPLHDEASCPVCQALGGSALPDVDVEIFVAAVFTPTAFPTTRVHPARALTRLSLARAPPHA